MYTFFYINKALVEFLFVMFAAHSFIRALYLLWHRNVGIGTDKERAIPSRLSKDIIHTLLTYMHTLFVVSVFRVLIHCRAKVLKI